MGVYVLVVIVDCGVGGLGFGVELVVFFFDDEFEFVVIEFLMVFGVVCCGVYGLFFVWWLWLLIREVLRKSLCFQVL